MEGKIKFWLFSGFQEFLLFYSLVPSSPCNSRMKALVLGGVFKDIHLSISYFSVPYYWSIRDLHFLIARFEGASPVRVTRRAVSLWGRLIYSGGGSEC